MTKSAGGFSSAELESLLEGSTILDDSPDSEEEHPDSEDELEEEDDGSEEEPEDDESDDEQPDESEEDEQDSEDDEESEEDDEDDDASDELSFDPALVVKLPDGSTTTLDELHKGYLRQDDYTRKTQRVAEIYRTMEEWYSQRASNPAGWIAEIAAGSEDPSKAIAEAIVSTGDATILFGHLVRELVAAEALAPEVVEAMGLSELSEKLKGSTVETELARLKADMQRRDAAAQQQAQMALIEQQLNQQWASVVTKNSLAFTSPQQELDEKVKVLEFARTHGIPNLEIAWAAMNALSGTQAAAPAAPKEAKKKAATDAVKKRKTAAMSRKPTGGGGGTSTGGKGGDLDVESIGASVLEDLGLSL